MSWIRRDPRPKLELNSTTTSAPRVKRRAPKTISAKLKKLDSSKVEKPTSSVRTSVKTKTQGSQYTTEKINYFNFEFPAEARSQNPTDNRSEITTEPSEPSAPALDLVEDLLSLEGDQLIERIAGKLPYMNHRHHAEVRKEIARIYQIALLLSQDEDAWCRFCKASLWEGVRRRPKATELDQALRYVLRVAFGVNDPKSKHFVHYWIKQCGPLFDVATPASVAREHIVGDRPAPKRKPPARKSPASCEGIASLPKIIADEALLSTAAVGDFVVFQVKKLGPRELVWAKCVIKRGSSAAMIVEGLLKGDDEHST